MGSISSGALFFGEFTILLTGCAAMSADGYGRRTAVGLLRRSAEPGADVFAPQNRGHAVRVAPGVVNVGHELVGRQGDMHTAVDGGAVRFLRAVP